MYDATKTCDAIMNSLSCRSLLRIYRETAGRVVELTYKYISQGQACCGGWGGKKITRRLQRKTHLYPGSRIARCVRCEPASNEEPNVPSEKANQRELKATWEGKES